MEIEIDKQYVDKCLPLGTGEDWKNYYAAFDKSPDESSLATLDACQQNKYIEEFKASIVKGYKDLLPKNATVEEGDEQKMFKLLPFISGFRKVLRGPKKDVRIHYPRQRYRPDSQGKNFLWFVDNERREQRLPLPDVKSEEGLPYTRSR